MRKWFAQVRRWGRSRDGPAPSYEVPCPCGQALRRGPPSSPAGLSLRRLRPAHVRSGVEFSAAGRGCSARPSGAGGRFGPWRLPLTAAAATLAVLVLLFGAMLPFLGRSAPPPPKEPDRPPDVRAMTTLGRRALVDGDFHLAAQRLQSALEQNQKRPDLLSPDERWQLTRLSATGRSAVSLVQPITGGDRGGGGQGPPCRGVEGPFRGRLPGKSRRVRRRGVVRRRTPAGRAAPAVASLLPRHGWRSGGPPRAGGFACTAAAGAGSGRSGCCSAAGCRRSSAGRTVSGSCTSTPTAACC